MKKIIFALIVLFAITFSSCDKNDVNTNSIKYSDEEILQHVKFMGQGNRYLVSIASSLQKAPNGSITIFKARLARKSKECKKGFGLCDVWIGPWHAWDETTIQQDSMTIILPYNGEETLNDIILSLSEDPGIDMSNVSLAVDDDIPIINELDESNSEIIPAGKYEFEEGIGEFGGFSLKVE